MNAYYQKLLSEIPEGLERKVYDVLLLHVGRANSIRIEDIAYMAMGNGSESGVRMTRIAIENLRKIYFVPVISESGKAGRWLAADDEDMQTCIAEMQSRREQIDQVIHALSLAKVGMTPVFDHPQQIAFELG